MTKKMVDIFTAPTFQENLTYQEGNIKFASVHDIISCELLNLVIRLYRHRHISKPL